MAIPDKPLTLNISSFDDLTYEDNPLLLAVMTAPAADDLVGTLRWVEHFKAFLKKFGDWTPEEIGKIAYSDTLAISKQLRVALTNAIVPLGSEQPSKTGQETNQP